MNRRFLMEISERIGERMEECVRDGMDYASCSYETECGVIEVFVDRKNETEVIITHDDDREREHPRMVSAIDAVIPDWDEVYNEVMREASVDPYWDEHGFRDAADYYKWRFG